MEPTASLVVRHAKAGGASSGSRGARTAHQDLPMIVREDVLSSPFKEVEAGIDLSKDGGAIPENPSLPSATRSHDSATIRGLDLAEHLGKVDFVSTTHNIKEIFKLPYTDDDVSLAIYRIGKTLVVNSAPMPSSSGCPPEAPPVPAWLKPGKPEDTPLAIGYEQKALEAQGKSMVEDELPDSQKLLEHLLEHTRGLESLSRSTTQPAPKIAPTAVTPVAAAPAPRRLRANSTSNIESAGQPKFTRVSCWKFNSMKMVLGSDLLTFRNAAHPCVSLWLQDIDDSISQARSLDLYLDNMMASVPELAVCYHKGGVVQAYQVVKTEDIPSLSATPFSVKALEQNARHLLEFLKSQCTKDFSAYWLFRQKGQAMVQLYDLESLAKADPQRWRRWKYMMAMLCYRFAAHLSREASSMKQSKPSPASQSVTSESRNLGGGSDQPPLANWPTPKPGESESDSKRRFLLLKCCQLLQQLQEDPATPTTTYSAGPRTSPSEAEEKTETDNRGSHRVMRAIVHEEVADSFIAASSQPKKSPKGKDSGAIRSKRKGKSRRKKTSKSQSSECPSLDKDFREISEQQRDQDQDYSLSLEMLRAEQLDDPKEQPMDPEQEPRFVRKSQPAKALDRERRPVNALNCAARHLLVGIQLARDCALKHIQSLLIPSPHRLDGDDEGDIFALEDEIERLKRLHEKLFVVGYRLADALRKEGQSWLAARCLNDTLGGVLVGIEELLPSLPQLLQSQPGITEQIQHLKPFSGDLSRSLLEGWLGYSHRDTCNSATIVGDIALTLLQENETLPTEQHSSVTRSNPTHVKEQDYTSDAAALGGGWTEEESDRLPTPVNVAKGSNSEKEKQSSRRALENLPYLLCFLHILRNRSTFLTRGRQDPAESQPTTALSKLLTSISRVEVPHLPEEKPFPTLWRASSNKQYTSTSGKSEINQESRVAGWTAAAILSYASSLEISEDLEKLSLQEASQTLESSRKLGDLLNRSATQELRDGNLHRSLGHFAKGIEMFERAGDNINSALLRCNVAHILRRIGMEMQNSWISSLMAGKSDAAATESKDEKGNQKQAIPGAEWRAVLMTAVAVCKEAVQSVARDKKAKERVVDASSATVRDALKKEAAQSSLVLGVTLLDVWERHLQNPDLKDFSFPEAISTIQDAFAESLALYNDIGLASQVAAVHFQSGCFRTTHVLALRRALRQDKAMLAGFGMAKGSIAEETLREEVQVNYTIGNTHFTKAGEFYLDPKQSPLANFFQFPIPLIALRWANLEEHAEGLKPSARTPAWTKELPATPHLALALKRLLHFCEPMNEFVAADGAKWQETLASHGRSSTEPWQALLQQLQRLLKTLLSALIRSGTRDEVVAALKTAYSTTLKVDKPVEDARVVITVLDVWKQLKSSCTLQW